MKNCPSCSKELPDAALHCVFCGAKQAAQPLVPAGANAKTVMGYGGQELQALLAQQQGAAPPPPAGGPAPPINPPPPSYPAPGGASAANAKTMFAPSPVAGGVPPAGMGGGPGGFAPPPGGAYGGPAPYQPPPPVGAPPMGAPPMGAPPMGAPPMGAPPMGGGYASPQAPHPATPMGAPMGGYPQPVAPAQPVPPYLASQTAARAGRPIEPWKDSLRLMMFIWGGLLLAAFATPLSLEPMSFHWDVIADAPGKAKLGSLVLAATGLLSVVIGAIPLAPVARGSIAIAICAAGVFVPVFAIGAPPTNTLLFMVGYLLLTANLLLRSEYRDALQPRITITLAAILALVPSVVPDEGKVPVLTMIEGLFQGDWKFTVIFIVALLQLLAILLSLLAWLPAPSSAGAKPLAWFLILFPLVMHATLLFVVGDPSMVEKSPYAAAASWIAGVTGEGGALTSIGVAYLAIYAYGYASVVGKKLERA